MLILTGFLVMIFMYAMISKFTAAGIAIFVDIPSAIILLVPLIFFLLATKSGKILGAYITSSFKKGCAYTEAELANIAGAAKNTIKFILGLGGFGFLMGIMATLAHLGDMEYLGPNLAVSLITVTYSITLSFFVFFPVQAWAENRIGFLRAKDAPGIEK